MTRSGQWYTNVDDELRLLRDRVAQLESQVASLTGTHHQGHQAPALNRGEPAQTPAAPRGSAQVMALLQRGQKIQAIKEYRRETGVGLKEAKEFIESLSG